MVVGSFRGRAATKSGPRRSGAEYARRFINEFDAGGVVWDPHLCR